MGRPVLLSELTGPLRSVPGAGPVVVAVFVTELPELGHLNEHEIATLVGVVPLNLVFRPGNM